MAAGYLELEEGTAPGTPAASLHRIYVDTSDDKVKHKLPSGAVVDLEAGSGTVTSVALALPVSVFTVSGSPVTTTGTLTAVFATQSANTIFSGPTTGAAATPTFRSLVADDIPAIDASKITTGILPIARGGTNSSTALVNNRVVQSLGGAIVEAAAITAARALISDGTGIPTHSTTTAAELLFVNGVTSNIQTQLDAKYGIIQDDGVAITSRNTLNFISTYADVADNGGVRTNVDFNINAASSLLAASIDYINDIIPIEDISAVTHYKATLKDLIPSLNPKRTLIIFEDMYNANLNRGFGFDNFNSGAGSSVGSKTLIDNLHVGLAELPTGSTAAGRSGIWQGGDGWLFGGGEASFETVIYIPTLSDGTETYNLRLGWGDSNTATESTDAVFFRYTNAENSGQWVGVARNNNVETLVNSTTAVVAGVWLRLTIIVNAGGTLATYYINGTSVGTVATNIPVGVGRDVSMLIKIAKTAGTTSRDIYCDYIGGYYMFTAASR